MPKGSKKHKQKTKVEKEEKEEVVKEDDEEVQKTSIQITTKVRDRLWRLKFRKTYDEFLWELCEIYEKNEAEEQT